MKVILVLLGTLCLLLLETHAQGFFPPPNLIDPSPHGIFQRQLTQSQQNHILSDIQQHQHRFTINQPHHRQHQQFTFQQQPSVELPVGQQHQSHSAPLAPIQQQQQFPNQRFPQIPPPPSQSGNPVRFPNNQLISNNQQLQQPVIQHHTQTNFIPNFIQQVHQQSSPNQQRHPHNNQFQRSPENQLQIPQQPFQQPNNNNLQFQQQLPNIDFHRQNFFALQNVAQPQQNQISNDFPPQQQFNPPQQQPLIPPVLNFQPIPPSFQQIPVVDGRVVGTPKPVTSVFYTNPQNVQQFQTNQRVESQFNPAPQIQGASIIQPNQAKDEIIQKHEAFVQKQYEKQQHKVKQLHQEFQQKQQQIKQTAPTPSPQQIFSSSFTQQDQRSRNIFPSEVSLFEKALKNHDVINPRPSTSTSTTTESIKSTEDPFNKLLQAQRKDIYAQLKLESATPKPTAAPNGIDQKLILQQLQKALGASPQSSLGDKKFEATDLVLPNGQKVQVIRTSDPNLIQGGQELSPEIAAALQNSQKSQSNRLNAVAPAKPQELVLPSGGKVQIVPAPGGGSESGVSSLSSVGGLTSLGALGGLGGLSDQSLASEARIVATGDGPPSLEELAAKGLIPEGYEIVQQPAPGSKPATAKPAPTPKKKPTFVYLEEQADGSFKIQGIKANGEKDAKTSGSELDNILERIQKGEIQLPPSVTRVKLPDGNELILKSEAGKPPSFTVAATTPSTTTTIRTTTTTTQAPTTITTTQPPSTTRRNNHASSTYRPRPTTTYRGSTRYTPPTTSTPSYNTYPPSTERLAAQSSTRFHTSLRPEAKTTPYYTTTSTTTTTTTTTTPATTTAYTTQYYNPITNNPFESSTSSGSELSQILKSNGLYAMAKYLKQSGLDSILNETGPYTVFVPTDKAFKNLLVQLGGPERAEEKFKANPRLLSGLLLHHVIPGSFDVAALQDEMTGVSLAGTQLRVNQYSMHDQEWNDVLITTINGAMLVPDKQDIKIPQGIAHGVDRVMFPLPVGDLLQTLQSDRERRFTTFLKVLYASGMSELLQNKGGHKTYTVFAPTDKAFGNFDPTEVDKLTTDKDAAQAFTMKYIMPGTLFSAGMRFYQVKDSLLPGNSITLQKTSNGKIKVNEAQMLTSNIPATNGVIHAIDGPI